MGDVTDNLSRYEFKCSCGCGMSDAHPRLYFGIQWVVDETGATSVWITGPGRCDNCNSLLVEIGLAAEGSKHRKDPELGNYTLAGDCVFRGVSLLKVIETAQRCPDFKNGGIGLYLDDRPGKIDRVHLDVRIGKARWGFVDGKKASFNEAMTELKLRTV